MKRRRKATSDFRKRQIDQLASLTTSLENTGRELASQKASNRAVLEERVLLRYEISFLRRVLFEKGEKRI